jgi:hypothetical protein
MRALVPFALAALISAASVPTQISAQAAAPPNGYPVAPSPMPEEEEIALARSAAPGEIAANADVWVLRSTGFARARSGTNGCACMVSRDLHGGSLYPICFDREATRTLMLREQMETTLRAKGMTEEQVKAAVKSAYARGELRYPEKAAMSYMMSSRQVLFSSAMADGRRVGAWSPHVMLYMPATTPEQFGLAAQSAVDVISVERLDGGGAQLVVKVPRWADSVSHR